MTRLERLEKKIADLQLLKNQELAKIDKMEQLEKERYRKLDTRAKIILGGEVLRDKELTANIRGKVKGAANIATLNKYFALFEKWGVLEDEIPEKLARKPKAKKQGTETTADKEKQDADTTANAATADNAGKSTEKQNDENIAPLATS